MIQTIDHADVVVTHQCPNRCPFCVDRFVHMDDRFVQPYMLSAFLRKLQRHACSKPNLEVLFLGGEPLTAPESLLSELTGIVKAHGFSPIVSTNFGVERALRAAALFDWVQLTVHSLDQIPGLRGFESKINLKLPGDQTLTMHRIRRFAEEANDFQRKTITMYFRPDFSELCKDRDVLDYLDTLDWRRNGSYVYAFSEDGIRFKRCIRDVTNVADEPTVPKLYPNGNYNKTWNNEDMDDYLGKADNDTD